MNLAKELADTFETLADYPKNIPMRRRWADHLKVRADSPDLFLGVTTVYSRVLRFKDEVTASHLSEKARGLYYGAAEVLQPFADPTRLDAQNTQTLKAASDKIDLLHLAADALPDYLIADIQTVTIEQLEVEIDALRQTVAEMDLDGDIRRLINASLDTLTMLVRGYKTFGPEGAARIYGSVIAELYRHAATTPPQSKDGKSAFKKLFSIVKKVGGAIVYAHAVVSGADGLIESGGDIAGFLGFTEGNSAPAPDKN